MRNVRNVVVVAAAVSTSVPRVFVGGVVDPTGMEKRIRPIPLVAVVVVVVVVIVVEKDTDSDHNSHYSNHTPNQFPKLGIGRRISVAKILCGSKHSPFRRFSLSVPILVPIAVPIVIVIAVTRRSSRTTRQTSTGMNVSISRILKWIIICDHGRF